MSKASLSSEWSKLAERFRRIASNDCTDADVTAAASHAGRLLYQTVDAGLLKFGLPERTHRVTPSDDDSLMMANYWSGFAIVCIEGNAGNIQWEKRGGPNNVAVGRTHKADWRIRAENYAAACDDLAALSGSTEEDPDEPLECYVTLDQMAAIVQRSKGTLRRRYDDGTLPKPDVRPKKRGEPLEWRWSVVRPVLVDEYGKNLPKKFPADRFVR